MANDIQSSIVRELVDSGIISIKNGEFIMWDIPGILLPLNSVLLLNVLKEQHPHISIQDLNYQVGKMHSHRGNNVLIRRFGYSPDKKLMQESFGKSELLGMGLFEFLDFDAGRKVFTVSNSRTPYARQCLKVFGKQKFPVCHYLRGLVAGSFQAFYEDEPLLGVELACIARGDPACMFRVKPEKDWDSSDPLVERQRVHDPLPEDVFDKLYSWENLISPDAGKPFQK